MLFQPKKSKTGILLLSMILAVTFIPLVTYAQFALDENDPCDFNEQSEEQDFIEIQTKIPGLTKDILVRDKESGAITGERHLVKDLPCFLAGIYKYFSGAAAIIATVMMMYGGYKYVISFGSAQKMKDAQDTIVAAMVGLTITLGSYLLLYTINPRLVEFTDLVITPVDTELQDRADEGAKQQCRNEELLHECGEPFSYMVYGENYWCCGKAEGPGGDGCMENVKEMLQTPGVMGIVEKGLCYKGWEYEYPLESGIEFDQKNIKEGEKGVEDYGYVKLEGGGGGETIVDCNKLAPPDCGLGSGVGCAGECVAEFGICRCKVN